MIGLPEFANEGVGQSDVGEVQILPDLIETLFAPNGPIAAHTGLQHRPTQARMAIWTAQAFAANSGLLYEAGTGVGKSLAYLIPAILHAKIHKRQCFVSTHTIALQEQIMYKDLGICRDLLGAIPGFEQYADFKTALLLGKGNYLCNTRLAQLVRDPQSFLAYDNQQIELERIQKWAATTATGLYQELSPAPTAEIWDLVSADASTCNHRNCSPDTCCYRRARERVRSADVLIVNHSLLFALLGAGYAQGIKERGILHPDDFGVLDEAHTVPAVAADYFGHRVSKAGMERLLTRLLHPKKLENPTGLLARTGSKDTKIAVRRAWEAQEDFFFKITQQYLLERKVVRMVTPGWSQDVITGSLKELVTALTRHVESMEEGAPKDELDGIRQQLLAYTSAIADCLLLADDMHAYWIEGSAKSDNVVLRSAPIDVAKDLREHLFCRDTSLLLTSATLAEGVDMNSFQAKIGAEGIEAQRSDSPFNYNSQMRVYVAKDMPLLDSGNRLNIEWLSDMVKFCALKVRGGTLVLFTSYRDMLACARQLEPYLHQARRTLLVQGQSGPRSELVQRMREEGDVLLFGTDSFWTGIDVPGPALSQVIITRLPFENPTQPLAAARADHCLASGGRPFFQLQLPEALVKFRQGLGRLIRGPSDLGTLTLLDSRLLHKKLRTRLSRSSAHGRLHYFQQG
ncbi:MAG: ATP-dependent DNA helicase [Verrucomicrobia bacterium]|nr:ATP-dependent DNA helicase [Verrucomicrobiota bacterium]